MKMKKIWLDCDGTWVDLYGVPNWLRFLENEDTTPFDVAKPLVNLSWLARTINELQDKGYFIGIISWLPKNSSKEYEHNVKISKLRYIRKHLPSVTFDKIFIVPYGTPKHTLGEGILFDDEELNRSQWGEMAFDETNLIQALRNFL